MEGLIFNRGAQFLVGVPHPTASAEGFARETLRHPDVTRALRGSKWRLLYVVSHEELDPETDRDYCPECEAVFFDYSKNRTVRVRGASGGVGPVRISASQEQPKPSPEEFADAVSLVAQSPAWGPLLQAKHVTPYEPMPPMLEAAPGETVERTLYVGLVSRARKFNRIVAVNMVRREVSSTEIKPRGARAAELICGVERAFCERPRRGTPGTAVIKWPAENPVWKFQAIRPSASTGLNASGIELRNVDYRGKRVFKQAHLPILNVQYDEDACGPFRDWQYEETCFQAEGEDIPGAPGFRWCTTPPQTVVESGMDGGNFVGVAVYEASDGALVLVTQLAAGWYRYIMEWRFHLDGKIEPRFRFDATEDTCTCFSHHHHAYWRFDFDVIKPNNVVEEFDGTAWQPIMREVGKLRQEGSPLLWRVREPKSNAGYEIIPGAGDGVGDAFSHNDQYVLKRKPKEIDDARYLIGFNAEAALDAMVKNEKVFKANSVIWYAAHFHHSISSDEGAPAHDANLGPTLVPFNWPQPRRSR